MCKLKQEKNAYESYCDLIKTGREQHHFGNAVTLKLIPLKITLNWNTMSPQPVSDPTTDRVIQTVLTVKFKFCWSMNVNMNNKYVPERCVLFCNNLVFGKLRKEALKVEKAHD